jgi:hypothetical protein
MHPPFDHLTDSDSFEQLCFDLLDAEGFRALCWRGPSADGGRDIEATWQVQDPTGSLFHTKWFIECKWYSDSVPFGEIEPKLLAASSARADYLLVMTSSRVRNTAIDRANEWLQHRGYPLRMRYWTGHDIVRLCVKHPDVYRKHFPHLSPPQWGTAMSELQRIRMMMSVGSERLTWRILPSINRLSSLLALNTSKSPESADAAAEIELISSLLRGHEFGDSPGGSERASSRALDLPECIQFVLTRVSRRIRDARPVLVNPLSPCLVCISRPLFICALFELALNAALYSADSEFVVEFLATDDHWVLRLRNKSSEDRTPDWPIAGYRGPIARSLTASGQGLGCWIAAEAARRADFMIEWSSAQGYWEATIHGARGALA